MPAIQATYALINMFGRYQGHDIFFATYPLIKIKIMISCG